MTFACSDDEPTTPTQKLPSVTTLDVTEITATTAQGGGAVTNDNGSAVTTRGVCWSTEVGPTIQDSATDDGSGNGSFDSDLTNLAPVTTYHVRAYATNSIGTAYGNEVTFETEADGFQDEGSPGSPVDITGLLPFVGQVSTASNSYYRITGVTPETVYTIILTRTEGLPYQLVANAGGGNGSIACGWNDTTPGSTIDCPMRADAGGALDFSVQGDDEIGGTFEINFAEGGIVNEGNPNDPVVVDNFPFSGEALVQSYYLLSGLTPGGSYAVGFTEASGPVALFIYPDASYQSQPETCIALFGSGNDCQVQANDSGQIFLLTSAQQEIYQVTYTISVTEAGVSNEGSVNAPIDITSHLPYSGMVHLGSSWYIIGDLTPGSPYTITLSDATDNANLAVYGPGWWVTGGPRTDSSFNWANGDGVQIACVSTGDHNGQIRIEARGYDSSDGANFILDSLAGGIPNEGYYGAPVDLTGQTPWSGTIYNGPSQYMISGLTPGIDCTVTISNLTDNLDLQVYQDAGFQTLLCASNELGSVDETCVVQTSTGELHIRVTAAFNVLGATFMLDVGQ